MSSQNDADAATEQGPLDWLWGVGAGAQSRAAVIVCSACQGPERRPCLRDFCALLLEGLEHCELQAKGGSIRTRFDEAHYRAEFGERYPENLVAVFRVS